MIKILQIETATQACSVAISADGKTIALKEAIAPNIHAGRLTLFIEEVMKQAGLAYTDLDAVAVSKGPGSYTGLRIGVSTAKGLCFATDKPLISIPTLDLMTAGFLAADQHYDGLVCPMIDARRLEVYTALYTAQCEVVQPVSAMIIDETAFSTELALGPVTFIGDGAEKCRPVIQSANAAFSTDNFNSAAHMSALAFAAFQISNFEDVAYFEPFYLKDFMLTQPKKLF